MSWEARGLPLDEQTKIAQELAQQHFQVNSGRIEFWGNIQGYCFQYADDQPSIDMTTTGQIISEGFSVPTAAKISVSGKSLEPLTKQLVR